MRNVRREIQDFERFEEIIRILAGNGFKDILTRLKLQHYLPITDKYVNPEPTPQRFRETVEDLGPVAIKFGQMLAERKDLIPEAYAEELKKLENHVPPFDNQVAERIVDEEVGLDRFEDFSEEPIASASIAQVHKATLENGDEVAVKVQRPGIKEQVQKDLDILTFLAKEADKHFNPDRGQLKRDVQEFADWTRQELDFRREASNGERLRENLKDEEKIRVPDIYDELTTDKVITSEFVDAVRCDDIEALKEIDVEFKDIATIGVASEMKQIFRDGFFHADPHPSNFMVDKEGNLVYVDFGIMGKMTPKKRRLLALVFYYTMRQDVDALYDVLNELGYSEGEIDEEDLKHVIEKKLLKLESSNLSQASFTRTFTEIVLVASNYGLYVPNDLIVMGKGLATMEGIGIDVYPDYSFEKENYDLLKKLLREQMKPDDALEEFGADLIRNKDFFTKLPSQIANMNGKEGPTVNVSMPENDSHIVPGALIVGSTVLLYDTLPTDTMILVGGLELLAAAYFLR